MKQALEILGLSPCHHMEEVFADPAQVDLWVAWTAGQPVDLTRMFAGYRAQVDWPGAHVWRELAVAYPDAKVIHTLRPAEKWWASFSRTIGKLMTHHRSIDLPPHLVAMMGVGEEIIGRRTFDGKWTDRDTALAAFARREAEVRAAIPAERLLVFDVAQGWEPLCAFLGKPVPDRPFPNKNQTEEFWSDIGGEPA